MLVLYALSRGGPTAAAAAASAATVVSDASAGNRRPVVYAAAERPTGARSADDGTAARNGRSTANLSHITGTARKIKMFIKNRYLQVFPDGTVNGTAEDTSDYGECPVGCFTITVSATSFTPPTSFFTHTVGVLSATDRFRTYRVRVSTIRGHGVIIIIIITTTIRRTRERIVFVVGRVKRFSSALPSPIRPVTRAIRTHVSPEPTRSPINREYARSTNTTGLYNNKKQKKSSPRLSGRRVRRCKRCADISVGRRFGIIFY